MTPQMEQRDYQSRMFAPLLPYMNAAHKVAELCLGLTWTYCRLHSEPNTPAHKSLGLAQTFGRGERTIEWSGTLVSNSVKDLAPWLHSHDGLKATVALAVMNALINTQANDLINSAQPAGAGNLAVFKFFREKLQGQKVVVIGRYPGLERALEGIDFQVLERTPSSGDLPDTAAEQVIPAADWVFITGTSLINHTFLRLTELAKNAVTVMMGPSVPWLSQWAQFDVDYIAGVSVINDEQAVQVAREGGGVRLFDGAVHYRIANVSADRQSKLKAQIADIWEQREQLKAQLSQVSDLEGLRKLESLDLELSQLDSSFKRLWDAQV